MIGFSANEISLSFREMRKTHGASWFEWAPNGLASWHHLPGNFLEEFFDEFLVVVAVTAVIGAGHVIVAELPGVIEDEVVGNVFDWGLGESGLVHHRGVFEILGPTFFLE